MINIRHALLAGIILAGMGSAPVSAHDYKRNYEHSSQNCFSHQTGSGSIRICTGLPERNYAHAEKTQRHHYGPVIIKHAHPPQRGPHFHHNHSEKRHEKHQKKHQKKHHKKHHHKKHGGYENNRHPYDYRRHSRWHF